MKFLEHVRMQEKGMAKIIKKMHFLEISLNKKMSLEVLEHH
jgi:hypothetical protein